MPADDHAAVIVEVGVVDFGRGLVRGEAIPLVRGQSCGHGRSR
jgi:hypothetical protein